MSNNQRGTVGVSAGDWVRLQRLKGARSYARSGAEQLPTADLEDDRDINPPLNAQVRYSVPIHSYPVVGTTRIRRTNSQWIDFRASQTADFVTSASTGLNGNTLSLTKLCNCTTTSPRVKTTGCSKCGVFTHKTIQ